LPFPSFSVAGIRIAAEFSLSWLPPPRQHRVERPVEKRVFAKVGGTRDEISPCRCDRPGHGTQRSPFAVTPVIELANDAPGYIPTRKGFAEHAS